MKKRFIAIIGATALCLSIATIALVAPYVGYGSCGGGYNLMGDADGNFLDQSSFEENIDNLIDSGLINEEDRDFFLERYEW